MKQIILLIAFFAAFIYICEAKAQQNINSLTTKDIKVNGNLEVNSTTLASKPCPPMTEVQRDAITPQQARCVFNTDTNQLNIYSGTEWASAGGGGISNWVTGFNYKIDDVVIESNKIYQCNTDHTSTLFASDISYWTQVQPLGPSSSVDGEVALFNGTGGDTLKRATGTGFAKLSSGVLSASSSINLSSDVSNVLPMANGGTDKALTPTLGGVVYTDSNSMEVLGAGTSGQVLKSNGAAAPTWQDSSNKLQGEKQSEVSFTKLKARNRSVVNTGSGHLLDDPENLLYNGSIESATLLDGWTCTNPSDFAAETSEPLNGSQSLKVQPLTVGGYTCYQDFNVNQYQTGQSVLLSAMVRTSGSDTLQICYRENGVVTSICSQAVSNGIPATEAVIGSSATSIGYQFTIPYNASGLNVRMDKFDMRIGTNVTNQPSNSQRVSYTPAIVGFGTVTGLDCGYAINGAGINFDCKFTSGTSTAVEARIPLPPGMTAKYAVIKNVGTGVLSVAAAVNYALLAELNSSYLTIGAQNSAAAGLTKLNANTILSSGQTISFTGYILINELASSIPTYTGRCNDPRACENDFSVVFNSSGVIQSQTFPSNPWIASCTSSSGGAQSCTYSSGLGLTTAMACKPTILLSGAGSISARVSSSTTTGFSVEKYTTTAASDTGSISISCSKQGVDSENSKTLQQNVALKSYVQTPNTTGKVGFCSAKISATGVISDQLGGCFASCTNATTPVCTFTSNYWKSGSVPNCWQVGSDGVLGASHLTTSTSSTFSGVLVTPGTNTAISGNRRYFCHGEIK